MKERIFTDNIGNQLIVQHRKSAVFLLRQTDLSIEGFVSPYWKDKTPIVHPNEMKQKYCFSKETFADLVAYLEQIAEESWGNFTPKVADSISSDYEECYDRDFGTEASLYLGMNTLQIKGPNQPKTDHSIIRLYKFNKRKFESLIFDLRKNQSNGA